MTVLPALVLLVLSVPAAEGAAQAGQAAPAAKPSKPAAASPATGAEAKPSGTKYKGRTCSAKVSGAVTGTFTCRPRIAARGPGKVRIEIAPLDLPPGASVFRGEVEVAAPHEKGVAGAPAVLKSARILLTSKAPKVTYGAIVGEGAKGSASLQVVDAPAEEMAKGKSHEVPAVAGGTLKATLVADDPKAGEVRLELKF